MQYKTLGNTGLLVSRICLGTMTFAGKGFFSVVGKQTQEEADDLIKTSIDAGVNFIDTADIYSEGHSEITLGKALKNLNIAPQGCRPRHEGLRPHGSRPQRHRRLPRPHHGRSRG